MPLWDAIDYCTVSAIYDSRYRIHQRLLKAIKENDVRGYVNLALGIEEPGGNYSAAEHGLGPLVLQQSSPERVFELATKLFACRVPEEVPTIIYKANVPYLKISVGSEMGALLKPDIFWVTNVRTVWAYLVMKHNGVERANEELRYYRTKEMTSEMEYWLWREVYPLVGSSMTKLAHLGTRFAEEQGVEPGGLKFLWADAIADTGYNEYSK